MSSRGRTPKTKPLVVQVTFLLEPVTECSIAIALRFGPREGQKRCVKNYYEYRRMSLQPRRGDHFQLAYRGSFEVAHAPIRRRYY